MKLFSGFKSKKFKTLDIGGGEYQISIPAKYMSEYDEEDTLLFYLEGEEIITIRVTVLSFDRKDGAPASAAEIVRKDAISRNLDCETLENGVVMFETAPDYSNEDGTDLVMQFWYMGLNNSVIIFSATTILKHAEREEVAEMKNDLQAIFRSIQPA
ncbi:MAG: hypothetical protein QM791_07865 [Ferruginibacter sp.]